MTGTLPPLLDSVVGGGMPERRLLCVHMDPMPLCPGKGLVLPTNPTIDAIAKNTRFFILSLPNNEMSGKSPFAVFKALQAIGEPKSVKKMKSGDLLIETNSAVQSKSYLSAKTFLDSPLLVTPHKSLNSSRGVISEPDLLYTSEAEILEGFSDQGVVQVRRITLKKDTRIIPTKHLILTFNSPKLPNTIKAGYLNCKIRPYIPNPLRCYKCQRFGHSQTSCRGQLTCSRCASVGNSSTYFTLEPKCVNCTESHPSNSKLCPKWKTEKKIQVIKTNRNIPYVEARKSIAPQLSQSYAEVTKPSTATQTDENITKIVCPPLKLLQPLIFVPKPTISSSVPAVNKSSTSTQAELLPSTSSVTSKSQPTNSIIDTAPTTSDNLSISATSSSSTVCPAHETTTTTSNTIPSTSHNAKETSKPRKKKRPPKNTCNAIKPKIEIKMAPHIPIKSAPIEYTTDEEDMKIYDVYIYIYIEDEPEPNPKYVLNMGGYTYKGELVIINQIIRLLGTTSTIQSENHIRNSKR
ncbi:putative RNA-directed DNA polymerase from transposon BS [Trichonephila clavipes]|nr:putative RNA-directed DNA polymerase from transposon BS [Trichonephila clavipes]